MSDNKERSRKEIIELLNDLFDLSHIDAKRSDESHMEIEDDIGKVPENLRKLLQESLVKEIVTDSDMCELIQDIVSVYNYRGRFSYSLITAICYELNDNEKDEIILWNLRRLHAYCAENNIEDQPVVFKLFDHVNLASKQSNRFKNITIKFDEKMEEEEKKILNKADEAILSVEETKRRLMGELVSLIAIFTALSFVLFGGISTLASLTNSVEALLNNGMSIKALYNPIIVWGIIMFNLLYLFMYFIFKITGNRSEAYVINKGKHAFCDKIKSHGLLFFINGLLILLFFVTR